MAAVEYQVTGGRVRVRARATLHSAEVSFPRLAGRFLVTFEGESSAPGAGLPAAIQGEVVLAFDAVEGGDPLLRHELRKALEPDRFPEARLRLKGVRPAAGALGLVEGELSYRERMVPLAVTVEGRREPSLLVARARFSLDVTRFGLRPPRLLFLKVSEIVDVEVELDARAGG